MALNSPLTPLEPTTAILIPGALEEDRATAALDPTTFVPRRDALTRLDYRLRRHTVPRRRALPGDYISLENGDGEPELVALKGKVIHIGRASSADLRFEDAHVSRRHAIIVRYGRHVRVLDDRSSAGTFVNGLRVIATDLNDGDVVRLGPIEFTYVAIH